MKVSHQILYTSKDEMIAEARFKVSEHESKRARTLNSAKGKEGMAEATEAGVNNGNNHSATGRAVEVDGNTEGAVQEDPRGEAG